LIPDIRLNHLIDKKAFAKIKKEYDYTIIAAGAKKPRSLPVPGIENAVFANDFWKRPNTTISIQGNAWSLSGPVMWAVMWPQRPID
jgi:NADPH-dependent glutamate synthase beta subunit-like oxidoreductase